MSILRAPWRGLSRAGQLARHGAGACRGAPAAELASPSPARSSLFVNNGAEKIAAEMCLGSALCFLNAFTPEVPARRRHKGCREGRKGWGTSPGPPRGLCCHLPRAAPGPRARSDPAAATATLLGLPRAGSHSAWASPNPQGFTEPPPPGQRCPLGASNQRKAAFGWHRAAPASSPKALPSPDRHQKAPKRRGWAALRRRQGLCKAG